jgi:hypothetical protein
MKFSPNVIIPDDKLSKYLLLYKEKNNKSKFLAQAGFTQNNPDELKLAIYQLISIFEAIEDLTNEYGLFIELKGS